MRFAGDSGGGVTLLGRVSGPDEVTVSINEEPVTLWGQDFAVTRDLEAGENLFTLVAASGGESTPLLVL